eukprot:3134117-Amphidinium_carterae.1
MDHGAIGTESAANHVGAPLAELQKLDQVRSRSAEHQMIERAMQIQHTQFQEHLEKVNGAFLYGLEQIQQEALQKQRYCEARLGQVRDQDVEIARDEATAITAGARDELASIMQQSKVAHDEKMAEVTAKAGEVIEIIAKRSQLAHDQQIALHVQKHDSEVAEHRDIVKRFQDEMGAMRIALENKHAHGAHN